MVAVISTKQLGERLAAGENLRLIDVRTPVEFREIHAASAENAPLDALDDAAVTRLVEDSRRQTLYLICKSGRRGEQACHKLAAAGASDVCNVAGGTDAWLAAGLPVVRDANVISLERQVRIAAGSLVLAGALLAWLVHPAWIGLSAFIGAGLVFSGITNTCGMALMLARMPWNRAAATTCATPAPTRQRNAAG